MIKVSNIGNFSNIHMGSIIEVPDVPEVPDLEMQYNHLSTGLYHTIIVGKSTKRIKTVLGGNSYDFTPPEGVNTKNIAYIDSNTTKALVLYEDGTVSPSWGNSTVTSPDLADIVQIACGNSHWLALDKYGVVHVWGGSFGNENIPSDVQNNRVIQVEIGDYNSHALLDDGTVRSWGSSTDGATSVPAGLSNVVQISCGYRHVLALKDDGTVVSWGKNNNGQLNIPSHVQGKVTQVAAGSGHSVVLYDGGKIEAWGSNTNGQLNHPTGSGYRKINTQTHHTLAERGNGYVDAWGYNGYSQCDIPNLDYDTQ